MEKHASWFGACLLALVVITGCSGQAEEVEGDDADSVVITISDYEYDVPDAIGPGTEITVSNEDSVTHTVTSDEEGLFDVTIDGGSEATFTVPDEPGEYPFHCTPHPFMTSTLVIE